MRRAVANPHRPDPRQHGTIPDADVIATLLLRARHQWREQRERQSAPLSMRFYRVARSFARGYSTRPDDRLDAGS